MARYDGVDKNSGRKSKTARSLVGPLVMVIFLVPNAARAAMGETVDGRKSATTLKIPEGFRGAIFICDPYCEAISVRREKKWVPPLENIFVKSTKMNLMPVTDPLFPYLFPLTPSEDKEEKPLATQPSPIELPKASHPGPPALPDKDEDEGPQPPKVAFENGFRMPLLINYDQLTLGSNSNIEGNFNGRSSMTGIQIEGDYFRAKPLRLLHQWWQFELGYLMPLKNEQFSLSNGDKGTLKETDAHLYVWDKFANFGVAFRYVQRSLKVNTPVNMLKEYSFSEDLSFIGLGLRWRRWDLYWDHGIGLSINEQQSYRDQLINFNAEEIGARYCFGQHLIFNAIPLNGCLAFSYGTNSNEASLQKSLGNIGNLDIEHNVTRVSLQINLGDDFNL